MCFVEVDEDGPCIRVTEFRPQPLRISFPGAKHGHHHHCHHRHHKAHHHCHHRRGSSSNSSDSDNSSDSSKGSKSNKSSKSSKSSSSSSSSKSSSTNSSKTSPTNTTITDTTSQNTSLICPPQHRHRRCSAPPVIVDWDSRHSHEHEKTREFDKDRDYDYTIRRTYTRRTRESIIPWRRGRALEIDEPGHRYVEYMEVPAIEWIPPRVRPRGRVCSDGNEVEVQYIAGR
ncbi:hypothetical protein BDW42DRAFT_7373 [Aspergillus taichungensis]|uniref:Uncharacterized protein n=1 Tax=Aspergillus taichungensis TaxID=482145 RepID=A0A2J5HJI1_9EURO|nr:hypothetical protein BDW42DRAFT_7373 [Aspergillus taichungensis]